MADEFPSTGAEATDEDREQLCQRIQELMIYNTALVAENAMFEVFISRLDQQSLVPQAVEDGLVGAGRVRRLRSRSNTADHLQLLSLEQKCYVAKSEVEATQQDLDKLKQRRQRIHDHYKASMKEAEIRLQEIGKAKKEFERKVVKPLKEKKWEIKEPDNVFRYIEDKSKVTQLDMLRLKNQALMTEEKELRKKLREMAEREKPMSQVEKEDMDQAPGGDDLEELQDKSFKLRHNLRKYQKKLQILTRESEELSRDIAKKTQVLKNMEEIIQKTEEERLKAEALNQHLHQQLTDYRAPDTLDYMNLKVKHKKLQHSVIVLERKARIAMNFGTHNRFWNKVRAAPTAVNSAEPGTRPGEDRIPRQQWTPANMADEFPATEAKATRQDKEQLPERIEELIISNAALMTENVMFESFISRLDQQPVVPKAMEDGLMGPGRGRRQGSRSNTAEHLQMITTEQKCYVAKHVVEATQKDLITLKEKRLRVHDHYKASMEEALIRLEEIRIARKEFERKVVKPLKENNWKIQEPETVFRCIEDRSKVTQLGMLRLKNQALKAEEKELQHKIRVRGDRDKPQSQEDMDQAPCGFDLEQLQDQNFKVQENLKFNKKKLQTLTRESEDLSRDIARKTKGLKHIEEIIQKTQEERLKAEALNQHLHQQLTDYHAPNTMDYMNLKVKHKKLQNSVAALERKAKIARNFQIRKRFWNKTGATPTAVSSAEIQPPPYREG
ncbi:cilia- and flagella-associated protein 263 [Genypterus blacodes]|uniref:cilia- and flagella-associated protein 263 n=1 Tax=Genypterus blacodes TaxID=154954 RepID=UPI003F76993B